MEKLKSVIPETLKLEISKTTTSDLHSTCSSLLNLFQALPLFHQMVRDLTHPEMAQCGKNKEAAMEAKVKGNECFSEGDYSNALIFYSQALRSAPMYVEDKEKNLVATVYLNRASSLHKLGLFLESLRDCSRALMLSPAYAKAWFRRAKANSSMGNYEDAINDLSVSLKFETSSSGKRQIESELNLLLDQSRIRSDAIDKSNCSSTGFLDEPLQTELQCFSTTTKGRGMTSLTNIPLASLIHKEDPYAAIVLKHHRETHCSFCFNELPADTVPCISCSIPLYCSLKCQVEAGGQDFSNYMNTYEFLEDLSDDLERYIRNVTLPGISSSNIKHAAEHRHECQGMHWSAVLPSDVVLAGRILVKSIDEKSSGGLDPNIHGILDLCQNYGQLSSETKLEFHVYSIILLCCLQRLYASKLPLNSAKTSEIIILLSKIRINSMAVARMKYSDVNQPLILDYDATSSMEQVYLNVLTVCSGDELILVCMSAKDVQYFLFKVILSSRKSQALTLRDEGSTPDKVIQVAQAVYLGGSLFNHSCQPNVHAYFLSRTLFVRATENVTAGSELELCYGPQVGQWDCSERRKFLKDKYSFMCQCSCCAQVNLSDLVHNGYRCTKPNCFGVVLDSCIAKYEKEKVRHFEGPNSLQEKILNDDNISMVAHHVLEQTDYRNCFEPGHCLSCGTSCDLQASQNTIAKAEILIRRMQDAVASGAITTIFIMDALKSVDLLRAVLHPFNKRIAEVEDNIAQAFCLIGELQSAMDHCQASIKILETLYGQNHIAIGNELIKLASIQLSMGQKIAAENTSRIVAIFSRYYGSHAEIIFPYFRYLKREA